MKYIYSVIGIVLIVVLTFCTGEKETVSGVTQNNTIPKSLSENAIFIKDSISFAAKTATDLQKSEGHKYFLRAMDLLINKQKPTESIVLFKDGIRYFPDTKMYFFLTKAYLELNDADNAAKANLICYNLGYDSYYELPYNDALIYAIQNDTVECINSLSEAIFEGFLNKNKIMNEKRFDFIREDSRYISMIVNTFNDDNKLKALLFKNYLKLIPDLNLPYSVTIDSISNHTYDKYINYDFAVFIPEMENGRFARDVTNEYLYVGKLNLNNNHHAVIYKSYLAIADTLNPVKTFVITYDSLGTIVDNEMIGCFCSPTLSQSYIISKDNSIETTGYTFKWKNEPLEKGYAGNQIISFETEKPKQIQIVELGIIKREGVVTTTQSAKEGG